MLLHERFTVPLKPFVEAMVIVEVAVPPAATEAAKSAVAAMVKSSGGVTARFSSTMSKPV